jgi:hypothetical protein
MKSMGGTDAEIERMVEHEAAQTKGAVIRFGPLPLSQRAIPPW